jgi:predicted acetyltransferase
MRDFRKLTEADFDGFVTILAHAYPGMGIVSAEDRERTRQRYLRAYHKDPRAEFYGVFKDDELLGVLIIYQFTMKLLSAKAKVGGVGEVAVDVLHRKEKVARDMMAYFLRYCQENGMGMAALYPFRPDFYRRMGFGYGTKMCRYRVQPASLPQGPSKAHVRFLSEVDKEAVLACHSRYADTTHGMMEKTIFELDQLFGSPSVKVVGYERAGEIRGYLAFRFERGKQDNWLSNDIVVRELVCENSEALSELLTFLHTQLDQVRDVVFDLHDDGFHFLLLDPRDGTDNLIGPVYHQSNTQGVGLMYRVVDTREVFRVLWDHNFGGQDCQLKLSIRDSFWPQNSGSTVVHFEGGRPHLRAGGDFEVEAALDVSDFSSLLMGVVSFRQLIRYGLAEISDSHYVNALDAIFRVEEKPVCTTVF